MFCGWGVREEGGVRWRRWGTVEEGFVLACRVYAMIGHIVFGVLVQCLVDAW